VLFHVADRAYALTGYGMLSGAFGLGNVGVDVFFVLSGFIIFTVHRADIGVQAETRRYAAKRIVRIFPLYWLVTAIAIPVYALGYGDASKREPLVILKSIFLFPQKNAATYPIVNVGWTLTYELLFYAMFCLLIAWPRRWALAAWTLWIGGVVALAIGRASGAWHPGSGPWFDVVLSERNLEFLLGCGVAWLVTRGEVPMPRVLLWGGLAAMTALVLGMGLFDDFSPFNRNTTAVFAIPAAVTILGAAALDRAGGRRPPQPLVRLGDASYALYLVHFGLLTGAFELYRRAWSGTGAGTAVFGLAAAAAVCVIGFLVHAWVEAPMLRSLRRRAVPGGHEARPMVAET
jgi:peptidoglycan/LPS O-acetylase OafA/YrhL